VRTAAIFLFLTMSAAAHADDGASLDLGYVRSRVAVTDQTALDASLVRFAIRVSIDKRVPYLHFGAEVEEGSLQGTTSLNGGAVARTAPGSASTETVTPGNESPLDGNVLALKVFAGFHANAGLVRVSADVAGGIRDAWVESDQGTDVAGRKDEGLLEVRSRIDVRVTPRFLVGATASSDLLERRDVSVGLVLTLDCAR
jgi:hypothetical protein